MAAFQLKNFVSIVASMVNWMRSTQSVITDFSEGSVGRTLVEGPAAEIEELYRKFFDGIMQAIPVATYNSFNFTALPAVPTSGLVDITIAAQNQIVIISGGTTITAPGSSVSYTTENDVAINPGNTTASVLTVASVPGSAGNIAAGAVFAMSPQPQGFVSCTNPGNWINGLDAETPNQQQVRFAAFVQTLSRATVAAIQYGLRTVSLQDANGNIIEKVASSVVVEPYESDNTRPVGLIEFYIFNGVGNTSDALVQQAEKVIYGYTNGAGQKIPGWKAAGVHVNGYAVTEVPLDIGGTITGLPGYQLTDLLDAANPIASNYVLSLPAGGEFELSTLIALIKAIPGVDDFIPADVAVAVPPTLGQVAGGTLAAQTYYVATSYTNSAGESLPSTQAVLAVTADHLLTIQSPPVLAGTTGWNAYVGTTPTTLELQNAEPYAIGVNYMQPAGGLVTGPAPPTNSTARFQNVAPGTAQKIMPGIVNILSPTAATI